MTTVMLDDKREINGIYFNDAEDGCYVVDKSGCSKIEVYGEPSEFFFVPWIAVYKGNEILTRIPAGMVQIVYAVVNRREA